MRLYLKILFVFLVLFIITVPTAFADVGPKPTLNIYVKNFDSKDYYLDVLVHEEKDRYYDFNNKYPEGFKELELYKYNEGDWLARHIRSKILFGYLKGTYDERKNMMAHRFSYHGVPQTFKIIIQDTAGKLTVSDEITTNQFNANVIYDMRTGKAEVISGVHIGLIGNAGALLRTILLAMILTITIELLIAIPYKIRPFKVVIWVNAVTQAFLHAVLLALFYLGQSSLMNSTFIVLEIIILALEYYLYKWFAANVPQSRLFSYVIVANLSTFLLGLIIQI